MKRSVLLAGAASLLFLTPAGALKPPPANLAATPKSETEMTLTWDATAGATLYRVERSTTSSGPWTGRNVQPPLTTYADSGLQPCTDYFFRINSNPSPNPWSATISARTNCTTQTNRAPEIQDQTFEVRAGEVLDGQVVASDPDGDPLTFVWDMPDPLVTQSDGRFSVQGARHGTVTVSDPAGLSATGRVSIVIEDSGSTTPPIDPPDPPIDPPDDALLAFPGAQGFGMHSVGGRGGVTCQVTTLADSGPGSLRACVDMTGPRNVVFTVAGYIECGSQPIEIYNPYISIWGQTAPGQGITLRNDCGRLTAPLKVETHDVTIQHIRLRPGGPPHNVASNGDGSITGGIDIKKIQGGEIYNVIWDHISGSWSTDEGIDISPISGLAEGEPSRVDRVTISNSMIYEGLRNHSKGPNERSAGVAMIGNLIASNTIRCPNSVGGAITPGGIRDGGGISGEYEFRNNVVYNCSEAWWDQWDGRGEQWANVVGNVFKFGPQSKKRLNNNVPHDIFPVDSWFFDSRTMMSGTCDQNHGVPGVTCSTLADPLHICIMDNIMIGFSANLLGGPPINGVQNPNDAHLVESTDCYTHPLVDNPSVNGTLLTPLIGMTGPALPSAEVEASVLENAGAFPKHRDSADAQIVADYKAGTGQIPQCSASSSATECNPLPWPTLDAGTAYPDSDKDGMSDAWEAANGGDPLAIDSSGYTNLERFVHSLKP